MKSEMEIRNNLNFLKNKYHLLCLSSDTKEIDKKLILESIDILIWVLEF